VIAFVKSFSSVTGQERRNLNVRGWSAVLPIFTVIADGSAAPGQLGAIRQRIVWARARPSFHAQRRLNLSAAAHHKSVGAWTYDHIHRGWSLAK
jgi:hypothetical protein